MTMTAVAMRRGALELIEAPIPRPKWGEVLGCEPASGLSMGYDTPPISGYPYTTSLDATDFRNSL